MTTRFERAPRDGLLRVHAEDSVETKTTEASAVVPAASVGGGRDDQARTAGAPRLRHSLPDAPSHGAHGASRQCVSWVTQPMIQTEYDCSKADVCAAWRVGGRAAADSLVHTVCHAAVALPGAPAIQFVAPDGYAAITERCGAGNGSGWITAPRAEHACI